MCGHISTRNVFSICWVHFVRVDIVEMFRVITVEQSVVDVSLLAGVVVRRNISPRSAIKHHTVSCPAVF